MSRSGNYGTGFAGVSLVVVITVILVAVVIFGSLKFAQNFRDGGFGGGGYNRAR